jgi:hypothetical protein
MDAAEEQAEPGQQRRDRHDHRSLHLATARAFSGKVDTGFPSENATTQKMLERFLSPVSVKPL